MNYLAVDDEPLALKDLEEALREAEPGCELHGFTAPSRALEYVGSSPVDAAFLDIELGSMNGLVLAKKLKDLQPGANIIFVTSHEQYALRAIQMHATGYLMKPALAEDIRRELTFLYGEPEQRNKVGVQTFGGFEVYVGGKPLQFGRAKAKELLAFLVDRRGVSVTPRECCDILFEDGMYDENRSGYFRSIVSELRRTLAEAGAADILLRDRNRLAVVPDRLDCDSYRFLEGDPRAVNSYRHNYLSSYSWAEFTLAAMDERL